MAWILPAFFLLLATHSSLGRLEVILIVKSDFKNEQLPKIILEPLDYENFIFESDIIIDKSFLIKDFIENKNNVSLFTCPRRWGKTINLNMIKTFLANKVDDNGKLIPPKMTNTYKLFVNGTITDGVKTLKLLEPLMVSRYGSLIDNYLAQCPVIDVNLARTFTLASNKEITITVAKMFNDHRYILNHLDRILKNESIPQQQRDDAKERFRLFDAYLGGSEILSTSDLTSSLRFLSSELYDYFNRSVFILIDEYHAPWEDVFLHESLSNDFKKKFFEFYDAFMDNTLNNNPYMEKALITGTAFMPQELHKGAFKNVVEYNMLGGKLMEHYGFHQHEIHKLSEILKFDPLIEEKQLHKWYKSYKANYRKLDIYNPLSISQFISSNKTIRYWIKTGRSDLEKNLMQIDSFREKFRHLLEGYNITVKIQHPYFTWEELGKLCKIRRGKHTVPNDPQFGEHGFIELYSHGYLTLSDNIPMPIEQLHLKFPNEEVSGAMKWELQLFYAAKLNIHYTDRELLKNELDRFLKDDETTNVKLRDTVNVYLNNSKLVNTTGVERTVRMILCYFSLDTQTIQKITHEVPGDRPDQVFAFANRTVIINTRINTTAHSVLEGLKNYEHSIKEKYQSNSIKFIGIGINEKKIDIIAEVKSL